MLIKLRTTGNIKKKKIKEEKKEKSKKRSR